MTPRSPLAPPLAPALARRVETLPRVDALPGGCAYEPKFDGWRLLVFADPVRLQTRSGRLITDSWPEIASAAARLPQGTVLDGELVIWRQGRLDFHALQARTSAAVTRRLARTTPASYAAFDVLATGGTDLRGRPYRERRAVLERLLGPLGPPLQPVPVTTDRAEAADWYEALRPAGIEGLVAKGLDQPYRGGRRDWLKVRHADTADADVLGVVGARGRPRALVISAADGTPQLSAPLGPEVRRQVAAALEVTDAAAGGSRTAEGATYTPLAPGLVVEIRRDSTREPHSTVVRLREAS
jgi:ATP-dependent DNA ligase